MTGRVLGGLNMANAEQKKKRNAKGTVSDDEVWSAIGYLDPEMKETGHNIAVTITLIAIFSICLACIVLLHLRGL
jgi:hypothetical protein